MKFRDLIDTVEMFISNHKELGLDIEKRDRAYIIDAGTNTRPGLYVGKVISEICMANMAYVDFDIHEHSIPLPEIKIVTDKPIQACLCSQSATWILKCGELTCYISGPGKVLVRKPKSFFEKLKDYVDDIEQEPIFVVECIPPSIPPSEVIENILSNIKDREKVYIISTSSLSLSGIVQICARVVEVLLIRMFHSQIELSNVKSCIGRCILPPLKNDYNLSIALCNDSIRLTGFVNLVLSNDVNEEIENSIANLITREDSPTFLELLKNYGSDFLMKIPFEMFSVSEVVIYGTNHIRKVGQRRIDKLLMYMM